VVNASSERFPLLAQAEDYVSQYFVRLPPADPQLEYGAIRGMVSALGDKFSFFIDPPVAQSESNVLSGQYGGIGVQIKRDASGYFALYPIPNSPADKAGVQNGDILLVVNGKDVPPTSQADAVDQLLRGEVKPGNGVTFSVRRGTQAPQSFTVTFAVIEVPSVIWRVLNEDSTIGYIQLINFTNRTPDELQAAIDGLTAKAVKGIVLDVRNNPGGLLDESVKAAGFFLNGGTVVIERTRTTETVMNAPEGKATNLPMVVLINGGTASAAELVAAALHDRGRALLIGQQSYGKGSVQLILELTDKSSMHLTTAEWLPPSRNALNGIGLKPDVPMIPDPNGRDVELGEALTRLHGLEGAPTFTPIPTITVTVPPTLTPTVAPTKQS
jgi:carboxyl-terminal processing protease